MAPTPADSRLRRRLEQKVGAYMQRHDLWPDAGPLVVAVSGGPDSLALLLILARLARGRQIGLRVAHFDHALRGDEASAADRAFVKATAQSLGLPFSAGRGDVRARARRQRLSLEDAARRERYRFLAEVAAEAGATCVATGHTASDQAETVLLNLTRGSGLDGLAAMSPSAAWPLPGASSLRLLRPLLCLSRDESVAYCNAAGVEPLQDESNQSADFRRNRVRNEVLPLLRQLNPGLDAALVRLADAAGDDAAYLDQLAGEAVQVEAGVASITRDWFTVAPTSLRARAVRQALAAVAGDRQGFSARNVADVERLALQGRTGDRLHLPRGLRVLLTREAIEVKAAVSAVALPPDEVVLPVPGRAQLGELVVAAGEAPLGAAIAQVSVDASAVASGLVVRGRRPGDRFQPLGLAEEKKLQDFLVDAHLARDQRDAIPLFLSPQGIVWVGGLRVADWARPRRGCETLVLSYR